MYECISFVCYVLLLPSAFKMLSLCLVFVSLITMCLVMFLLRLSCLGLFVPLGLEWLFLFPCWGKFQLESLQKFSHTISFPLHSSETSMIWILVHLIWSQRSLRLCSALLILFTLFYSSEVISTICLPAHWFHSSALDILILILSRVFLISIIVLFVSVCLFFNSSRSFLIDSWFSPFCFQGFWSSSLSLFWIIFQITVLFPLHLFRLLCF